MTVVKIRKEKKKQINTNTKTLRATFRKQGVNTLRATKTWIFNYFDKISILIRLHF